MQRRPISYGVIGVLAAVGLGLAASAVAPVDGRVTRVTVHPGIFVNIGDIVAVIQPQ